MEKIVQKGTTGVQTEQQKQISKNLKALFPNYLNSLDLIAADGTSLTLHEDGTGSFLESIEKCRAGIRTTRTGHPCHNQQSLMACRKRQ